MWLVFLEKSHGDLDCKLCCFPIVVLEVSLESPQVVLVGDGRVHGLASSGEDRSALRAGLARRVVMCKQNPL